MRECVSGMVVLLSYRHNKWRFHQSFADFWRLIVYWIDVRVEVGAQSVSYFLAKDIHVFIRALRPELPVNISGES